MGYYCYAYDFLDIEFKKETEPVITPAPAITPVAPAEIFLALTCSFAHDGFVYDCESIDFTGLQGLTSCVGEVTFTYAIMNYSNGPVRLSALLDTSFVNLANGEVLSPYSETKITKTKDINVCDIQGTTIERTAYALASPVRGGIAASASDSIKIALP